MVNDYDDVRVLILYEATFKSSVNELVLKMLFIIRGFEELLFVTMNFFYHHLFGKNNVVCQL